MDFAYRSDIGQQREENEDYVGFFQNKAGINFAIVADGIGATRGAMSLPRWQSRTWVFGLKIQHSRNPMMPSSG